MVKYPYAEKYIAQQAEKMLTAALRSKISTLGFKNHVAGTKKSVSEAIGKSDWKIGGTRDKESLRAYMNKLSMVMEKHGYIQNYGDNGVRSGGTRTRTKPQNTTYSFKTHVWKLPPNDFIEDAIRQSGVIDYVISNVTKVRGEAIVADLLNFFDNKKF